MTERSPEWERLKRDLLPPAVLEVVEREATEEAQRLKIRALLEAGVSKEELVEANALEERAARVPPTVEWESLTPERLREVHEDAVRYIHEERAMWRRQAAQIEARRRANPSWLWRLWLRVRG
jgi:hypothetical protein